MAKPKIKFDATKIKQFLINHGEKLVLGLCGLIFLMLIYGMLGLEGMNSTPQDLRNKVDQARDKLNRSQLNIQEAGIVVKDYSDRAADVTRDIQLAGYDWEPVDPAVWPPGAKRPKPELLAVENLQVHAGLAAFDLRPESAAGTVVQNAPANAAPAQPNRGLGGGLGGFNLGGGAAGGAKPAAPAAASTVPAISRNAQGLRYAVILGLVPLARQTKAYEDAFSGVSFPRPETDLQPRYRPALSGIAAWVQRTEVRPGTADAWEYLDHPNLPKNNNQAIKSRYNGVRTELADPSVIDKALAEPLPPITGAEWDAAIVVHDQLPRAAATVAATQTQTMPVTPAAPNVPQLPGMEGAPGESTPETDAPADEAAAEVAEHKDTEYLLFRYFDFTAEPGKTYKYRVTLTLENPNFDVEPQYLEDPTLAKGEVVLAPFSQPSSPATLPYDGNLFAGEIVPANAYNEMAARVAVEQWLPTGGMAQQVIDRVFRGRLANFQLEPAVLVTPGGGTPTWSEKGKPYRVRTELTVVDMMGSAASGKTPADLLVLDSSGRLTIRKAESDQPRFAEIEQNVKGAGDANKKSDPKKDELSTRSKPNPRTAADTKPPKGADSRE